MRIRAAALAVLLTVCAASSASAAPWKRVTTPDGASTDQVGLARTGDGVLHLVWSHPTGPNTEDLNHTVILRNGRLGATNPVQTAGSASPTPRSCSTRVGYAPSGVASAPRTRATLTRR